MVKLDTNAHNFGQSGSNSIKITILDSSHQNFSNDKCFCLVPRRSAFSHCLSIVFGNDIIMTLFLSHGFQICIFCGTISLQGFNAVGILWRLV